MTDDELLSFTLLTLNTALYPGIQHGEKAITPHLEQVIQEK